MTKILACMSLTLSTRVNSPREQAVASEGGFTHKTMQLVKDGNARNEGCKFVVVNEASSNCRALVIIHAIEEERIIPGTRAFHAASDSSVGR